MKMAKEIVRAPSDLSVWQQNMNVLNERQPKLAKVLKDYTARRGHEFEHYENATPAGRWIQGLSAQPFFEPSGEPKFNWNKKSRETPVFFQYGAGAPPYLFKSIRALPREALSLIVVEPNIALLAYILHVTQVYLAMPGECSLIFLTEPERELIFMEQPEELRERLLWSTVNDLKDEAMMAGLNKYGLFSVLNSLSSMHQGEQEAMEKRFRDIAAAVKEWSVIRVQQLGNSAEDTMIGLRQMALMSPWISYGYQLTSMVGKFKGRPFVVVSAGPSLDKNFELLRDIRDKCVIVATDAVLGKMIRSGIMPHIVCALERGLPTYNAYFAGNVEANPRECENILLVTQAVCTPKIFGRWPGPKIIIGKAELPIDKWFIVETIGGQAVPSGSSVAHTCYSISLVLGASSVALIGQDLAFAEDGYAHAGGVYSEGTRQAMRKTAESRGVIKVAGSLGGEVLTNNIYLMFLRTFESMIHNAGTPTYDCTEGGALIKGTKIEPFASYIEREVAGLAPLETTPIGETVKVGLVPERKSWHSMLSGKIKKASEDLDHTEKLMADIKGLMGKVSAPALDQKRRVAHAGKVGALLDEIHDRNRMIAFVTQSYVYLATSEIMKVRFLDSMDLVRRWVKIHQEILDAHAAVVAFTRKWLNYAKYALDYYAERDLPLTPLTGDLALERLNEIEDTLGDGHDQTALQIEMDYLLSSVDIARLHWSGRILWQCAMFLLQEGRSEEAGVMMKAASDEFDGKEMPKEQMVSFFKDYARVLSTPDLCFLPDYKFAETVIDNAVAIAGIDDEIREIRKKILYGDISLYSNYAQFGARRKSGTQGVKWLTARSEANDTLANGDVIEAMRMVWKMICDYGEFVPEMAAPHLDWLATQMEKFFGAEDEPYKSGIDQLLSDIVSRVDVLANIPIMYTENFRAALAERGLTINIEGASKVSAKA
jgi:hypothetical protein